MNSTQLPSSLCIDDVAMNGPCETAFAGGPQIAGIFKIQRIDESTLRTSIDGVDADGQRVSLTGEITRDE